MVPRSTSASVVLFALLGLGLAACGSGPPRPFVVDPRYVPATHMPVTAIHAPLVSPGDELIAPPVPTQLASIESWRARYPDASRGLAAWRHLDEYATEHLVAWDALHPDGLRIVVLWAITHPNESAGAFLYYRSSWHAFAEIVRSCPAAIDAFLHWARRSAPAAEELVTHASPLSWLAANPTFEDGSAL